MADRRVLFFGDSLVAGVGDPAGLGWVGRVAAASFATGLPLTAYNLGVRGQTSVQVAARFRAETLPRLTAEGDCRIVLSFGANDTTIEDGRARVEAGRTLSALGSLLDAAQAMSCPVFVIGPSPIDDAAHNERLMQISVAFSSACGHRRVPFVSVIEALLASPVWRKQVAAGDGSHPDAEGYALLAELILTGGMLDWLAKNPDEQQL